jgi:cysteine desulfurase/selenocysteine lyase
MVIYKMRDYKKDFPFFSINKDVVYLDSSATTQKPQFIIDLLHDFYLKRNANAGRGSYPLSTELQRDVELVRNRVGDFIKAKSLNEIFFSSGASDAQQKIALSFLSYLKSGDEVLYSPLDHRSFVSPWVNIERQLAKFNIKIKLIPYKINQIGCADIDDILTKITDKTRVINITHIHNIFGSDVDIHKLKNIKKQYQKIIVNVDASQSIGHADIDVVNMGADILSFSGHKMFSTFGTGVLYCSKNAQYIIDTNHILESGTKDYAGILSLGEAVSYINSIGIEEIHKYLADITQYAIRSLKNIPGIFFTRGIAWCPGNDGYGILSFNIEGVDPADIAFYLARKNIMVRAGYHCSMSEDDDTRAVRISMHIYNSKQDVDLLANNLGELIKSL